MTTASPALLPADQYWKATLAIWGYPIFFLALVLALFAGLSGIESEITLVKWGAMFITIFPFFSLRKTYLKNRIYKTISRTTCVQMAIMVLLTFSPIVIAILLAGQRITEDSASFAIGMTVLCSVVIHLLVAMIAQLRVRSHKPHALALA
jgi:hypothetical protein